MIINHKDTEVPNLHAWVLMRSLKSKGVVEEVFNWRHHYFYVKSEGLKVLRDALGIVEENVVPITFKKTKKDHLGQEEGLLYFYFCDLLLIIVFYHLLINL